MYDSAYPLGKMVSSILASLSGFEAAIIRFQMIERRAGDRQRGRLKDKRPRLNHQQRAHSLKLVWDGKKNLTGLAGLLRASRVAISQELKKAQGMAA